MRTTKDIVEEAVAKTLDPTRRKALISRLENSLSRQRFAMILMIVAWSISVALYLIDRMDGGMMALFLGMVILSVFGVSTTIQRLVQLRLEEERTKTESGRR